MMVTIDRKCDISMAVFRMDWSGHRKDMQKLLPMQEQDLHKPEKISNFVCFFTCAQTWKNAFLS